MNNLFKPAIDGIEARTQFQTLPVLHPHPRSHVHRKFISEQYRLPGGPVLNVNQVYELFSNHPLLVVVSSFRILDSIKRTILFCRRDFECPGSLPPFLKQIHFCSESSSERGGKKIGRLCRNGLHFGALENVKESFVFRQGVVCPTDHSTFSHD